MKKIVFAAFLLIQMCILLSSCVNKHEYIYLLHSHKRGSGESVVKADIIKAPNDSIAYLMAFEKFCNSVYGNNEFSYNSTIPEDFILRDENDKEVQPISDSVLLSSIEKKVISTHKQSTIIHSSSSTNSDSDWKARMETDEYKASLAREIMLKNAGLKDAARIEREQRNNYLRGGGYDSKDGGKQVHYKGSAQQQRDLDAIDKYMREHPDF